MMSETNKDAPRSATPPPVGDPPAGERKDDSGVHDMKALAQTTKQRISRRITSQHDAYEESLLTSSQSGLRAVALPAPAQVVSLPAMPSSMPGAAEIAGAEAAGITPIEAARAHAKKGKGVWIVAAGGVIAAAAAAVFVITAGANKKEDSQAAATATAGGSAVAMKEAAGAPLAQGAAAGSGAGTATTVTSMDPAAAAAVTPPAEEAAKAEAGDTQDRAGATDKVAAAPRADGRSTGEASGSAARGGEKPAKGRNAKASGGAGTGGGGGGGGGAVAGGGAAPKGPGGDSMEELLAAASGGAQKPTEGTDSGAAKPEKTGLDGKDIRSGMGAVAKKAQACFDSYGIAGHVKIKATVDPSGKVTKADAQGEFAGTPTGTCVAAAAKSASFPEWTGAPMTISYGFTLTE